MDIENSPAQGFDVFVSYSTVDKVVADAVVAAHQCPKEVLTKLTKRVNMQAYQILSRYELREQYGDISPGSELLPKSL